MSNKIKLDSIVPSIPESEKGTTFIYTLHKGQSCIYVGQSKHLGQRIYQHLADGKVFDRIEFDSCRDNVANLYEANSIIDLKPELNRELPPTDKYIGLSALKSMVFDVLSATNNLVVFKTDKRQYVTTIGATKLVDDIKNLVSGESH